MCRVNGNLRCTILEFASARLQILVLVCRAGKLGERSWRLSFGTFADRNPFTRCDWGR